ncbi:MAG: IclR family transcriptional regulator [Steroidobacteraceae bacterium]|nr:IclR family transcriptional regulator [Steroidobacteraceae bacterium]
MKKKSGRAGSLTPSRQFYSAPALEKGIEIVELLASVSRGLTVSEIAARLDRSMNEVFRIILVMVAHGLLRKDPETDLYSVTYKLLELALRATPAKSLSVVAVPIMEELTIATNQSVHTVVHASGHGLIVLRQENVHLHGGFAVRPGATVDLVTTCSGHVLLAFAAPHFLEHTLKQLPKPLPWSRAKLDRTLATVRRRGYEMQPSLRTAGVTDISFPVYGFDGTLVAAMTVPYLARIDDSAPTTLQQTRVLLGQAAWRISSALGAVEKK